LNVEHLNICGDVMLATEVEHFLRFGNTTDGRNSKIFSAQRFVLRVVPLLCFA
jgi:hypothetical protein